MPLVYALVARGKTILAENTTTSGNFEQIARMLLPKLQPMPYKQSIEGESHTFHLLVSGKVFFLVLADKSHREASAFQFLAETKQRFDDDLDLHEDDLERAIAYAFNAQFSSVLGSLMAKYNQADGDGDEDEVVQRVRGQLEDVKDVMRTNIDSLLNRGERIDLLVESTERLTQASFKFQESATRLKDQMWWEKTKYRVLGGSVVLLLVFFFFVL
ncbi:hypothetical protein BASA81_003712 [Batrachochytrium salamandrivorans]|nr:hypothetical protein BASA81_003712 [Batrachochytrium salamandrivorans]